jgi:hypothetical protein
VASVIHLFRNASFDPEGVEVLCAAYEIATKGLHDRDRRPAIVNEVIAARIIKLAEAGLREPHALAERALAELGISGR